MTVKAKLYSVLTVFVLLLLLAGFGYKRPKEKQAADAGKEGTLTESGKTLDEIKHLGGVECRMPENSALVFWGSTMGKKISSYTAYGSLDEALCSLRSGKTDALWACDVTADYLTECNEDLAVLSEEGMSDIENTKRSRLLFGMALRDDEASRQLCEDINQAMKTLRDNGKFDILTDTYIKNADKISAESKAYPKFTAKNMKSSKQSGKTLYVGISGAVAPLELLDEDSEPYGFCAAFMDEIGLQLKRPVKLVVLDNETIFTSLMSGRIDLVMTYGTGNITTETKKNYIMTDGYYTMTRYKFLVLRGGTEQ